MANNSMTKKIKLMFCIDYIDGSTGGTENQLIKLINYLNHEKYDLYLLCLRNTPWLEENKSKLKCTVTAFNYNELSHGDFRNFISFWMAVNHMKKVIPDIMIVFFPTSYILGVIAARLAGVKIIMSTRRDYGLWLENKGIYALRLSNRFVHGIITNSQKVKELTCLKEHYDRSKVRVIYNGIEAERFSHSSDTDLSLKASIGIPLSNKVIGIVAGLRPMKHHATFLNAAKRVLKIISDVSFVLIGDGPLRGELGKYATYLGIGKSVHFLGWQTDIPRYLSLLDIGANCSANEGLSNAIMEYMAAGVPTIVSDAGGNTELIEHGVNGYVFELDDDTQLAEYIISLLKDKDTSNLFSSRSKEIMKERFGIDKMLNEYDILFTNLLKGIYK